MKTMLILTGPQGSGNHLFAKLFSEHPAVHGWEALKTKYWEGHDEEPFYHYWKDPLKLAYFDWSQKDYYVTSISCPYRDNGEDAWPNYYNFLKMLGAMNINYKIGIIGRDQNILKFQEERLRGRQTYNDFMEHVPTLVDHGGVFLSQELLYLYKEQYVLQLENTLNFPIKFNPEILTEDANAKYMQPIESNWLDTYIHLASKSDK